MLTRWLIARRDAAALAWLSADVGPRRDRARLRLALWDTLLDTWTHAGTRRLGN